MHHRFTLHALFAAFAVAASPAAAESLIVGIPSVDVTERSQVAITQESQALDLLGPPSRSSFSFVTYGVVEHLEHLDASLSLVNLSAPRAGELVSGAGFKYVLSTTPSHTDAWEPPLSRDTTALFSLERSAVGGWAYAPANLRQPVTRTRLTAGVSYGSELLLSGAQSPVNFVAGVEQPLTPWLWQVADW